MTIGNGTSPTSAGTASLSGTSQTSLASAENGGSPRLKMAPDPPGSASSGGKKDASPSESIHCKIKANNKVGILDTSTAPIATIDGQDDPELKLDGGEVTRKSPMGSTAHSNKNGSGSGPSEGEVTTPPSCSRLDEASQARVWWRPRPGEAEFSIQLPPIQTSLKQLQKTQEQQEFGDKYSKRRRLQGWV